MCLALCKPVEVECICLYGLLDFGQGFYQIIFCQTRLEAGASTDVGIGANPFEIQ